MTKTIRDTILAYPGLSDCEEFLDNVVLPGRGFEGTEDSKTIDIQKQKLVAADLYSMVGRSAGLHGKQAIRYLSPFVVRGYGKTAV